MKPDSNPEAKRQSLRDRLDEAQHRLQTRPVGLRPGGLVTDAVAYAKERPAIVIGGVAALALAIGVLARRGSKLTSPASLLTTIATDAAIAFTFAVYEKAMSRADEDDAAGKSG